MFRTISFKSFSSLGDLLLEESIAVAISVLSSLEIPIRIINPVFRNLLELRFLTESAMLLEVCYDDVNSMLNAVGLLI